MKTIRFYFINIILGILIIGIVAVVAISMFCTIHKVTVEGSQIYSQEEVTQMVLDGKYPNNAVYVTLQNALKPKKDLPFIEKAKVTMTRYDRVKISVTEKECVGFIAMKNGKYAYFDQEGTVVEVSERLVEQTIGVTGVTLKKAQIGEKVALKKEQLNLMVQLLKAMKKYDLQVSALSFDAIGNATVTYGQILISMGKAEYLEEKMMRLSQILPSVEGQTGTLHLENWSKDNTDIVFRKQN